MLPAREVTMKAIIRTGLVLTLGTAMGIGGQALDAADKKEVYVPPAATKMLVDKPLAGVNGKQLTIMQATLKPGFVGGKHYHTGPVYVYVLEGVFTVDEPGKSRQSFKPGQVYEEPIGTPMQAFNVSTSETTRILVIQVNNQGEPMMYKAAF
jgi:quercetin dioxygenase-like cupin family protein